MQTEQVRASAKIVEIHIGWKARRELIRSIQEKKGEAPCFQTGRKSCDRYDCTWRDECKPGEVLSEQEKS